LKINSLKTRQRKEEQKEVMRYSDRHCIQSWLLWRLSACARSSFHQRYAGDKTVRCEVKELMSWEVDGLSMQQKKAKSIRVVFW